MSAKKLVTFLFGVGVSQIALYPKHKEYQERSHSEMQELLKEHRQVIEEAQNRLNQRSAERALNQQ